MDEKEKDIKDEEIKEKFSKENKSNEDNYDKKIDFNDEEKAKEFFKEMMKKENASEEDLDFLVKQMEELFNSQGSNLKMLELTKKEKIKVALLHVIEIVLSIVLLIASIGYLGWAKCDKIYEYFILIGGIVTIEYVLRLIIDRLFFKFVIISFGTIRLLPPLIAFIICSLLAPGVSIVSIGLLILSFVLYLIIKKVFMDILSGKKFITIKRIEK